VTELASPPPGSASVDDGPDDAQLANDDAEHGQAMAAIRFNEAVAERARFLKIDREARARLRAEDSIGQDFDGLFLDRQQLRELPAPKPLITGVLPRETYGVLRGRDQSFKSFVAIDWAACIATGKAWQGHAVEQGRVLYIAGEGANGISTRLDAWEFGWSRPIDRKMFTTRKLALNMYEPGPPFAHLLDHIEAGGYTLVVVDTLRRVSGAADGNGSEMGRVIDNLDLIKQATTNGSVLVISHTDKQDNDSRGYSGIEDDADVVWHAKRDEMFLKLDLTKLKDGPDGRSLHLEALPTMNSLVLSGITGLPSPNTTESQLKILNTLREMAIDGMAPTPLLKASGLADSTFYRAIKELHQAGQIQNIGTPTRKIWALPAIDTGSHDLPDDETAPDLHDSHNSHDSQPSLPLTPTTPTTLGSGSSESKSQNGTTNNPDQEPPMPPNPPRESIEPMDGGR
jgi:hypothetical protein